MDSKEKSDGPPEQDNARGSTESITIHVHPTTGGNFEIEISPDETAEELRRKISRKIQTPKERLKVLFKEQVLDTKPLKDYKISDGCKVTLLPSVESGFSSTVQGTQQSIIQAIESLSDPQIDDFLSGRLPLTLALRVGDHMMFVQLQLEQSQANSQNEPRPSRSHSSAPFSQIGQSVSPCISQRLFTDMQTVHPLGATAVLPKPPIDFTAKKSSPPRTALSPTIAEPVTAGPAPKVPKLTTKSDVLKNNPSVAGTAPRHFHHHSAPSSPDEVPYAIFDPRLESLHHYNQITSHINHHAQGGANHLHRLVTACSSLEQVVAIPPAGVEPLKLPPMPETARKSSRKRPSSLLNPNPNTSPPRSSRGSYRDNIAMPTTAALIRNALLHHPQLSGFPGLPPTSLMSKAYAEYQASSRASQSSSSSKSNSTSPTTPPAEIKIKHPITSNMLQASSSGKNSADSNGHSSRPERSHQHRRASTSGRLTSGSLSHHTSGISGARVARQMQRLRRLCGSHQQCVAYSNRELATEISSIVHMARHSHHTRTEGSSHRKSHKACRECHGRERVPGSSHSVSSSGSPPSTSQAGSGATTGACIDSFTTHGPGIFSGTFSGSLHPSIQDPDGKPKRDPKTILQILTDLLNATQQYQGQLGNVGLLPQLFKDHFKGDSADNSRESKTDAPADEKAADEASTSSKSLKAPSSSPSVEKIHPSKESNVQQHTRPTLPHPYQYLLPVESRSINQKAATAKPPAQYLSSVSTIPIGNIPVPYGLRHLSSRSSRRSSPTHEASKHHRHHHARCHHYKHHGLEKPTCCTSSTCRRQAKHQLLTASYVKREHENSKTKNKMKELKKVMDQQRHRRRNRRDASKVGGKRAETEAAKDTTDATEPLATVNKIHDITTAQGEVKSRKMEVQFEDIKEFEIKEVAHEPPETVTV